MKSKIYLFLSLLIIPYLVNAFPFENQQFIIKQFDEDAKTKNQLLVKQKINPKNRLIFPSLPSLTPKNGTINNLVVFIRFSDQPDFTRTLSYYDSLFNLSNKSLKNFYIENSYNALIVNSTFYPSSNGKINSYQDPHPTAYYQPYNSQTNPIGYQGADIGPREDSLVSNALKIISAQILPGLNLDVNNDGYIDHICFEIYSSVLNPPPSMFWSRASYNYTGTIKLKGIKVGNYTWICSYQDETGGYLASVEIHEMGHSFGYPDLRSNSGRNPVGDWDVMSLSKPVHSGAYMKYRFTNWITNIPEITSYGTFSINDITQPTNNCYKIKSPNTNNEFFILEYRKASGPFESNLYGSGLCITRINESAGINGNLSGPPWFIYYYRADGTTSNDGHGNAWDGFFSSESGRLQFNDHSNPSCFLSDGSVGGISIYNIGSASGSSITFSVGDPKVAIITHNISGYLYNGGNRIIGATITLSGDQDSIITTINLGTYLFTVKEGGNYTVTPGIANMTFNPINKTINNITSDQIQNFSASNNTNTISGKITSDGNPLSGVTITCWGVGITTTLTDSNGFYSLTVNSGGNYTIQPSKTNYLFLPTNKSFTNITDNQVQNFSTITYNFTLSGTVYFSGYPLSKVQVNCPGANSTTPIITDASGIYSFNVSSGNGMEYKITPYSPFFKFLPKDTIYSNIISNKVTNFIASPIIKVKDTKAFSEKLTLYQNYPNPFNPSTVISYTVGVNNHLPVQLKIFDVFGREVETLVNKHHTQGIYQIIWSPKSAKGGLPSGIYYYRIQTENFIDIKKMLYLR